MNFKLGFCDGRFSDTRLFTEEQGILPDKLVFNLAKDTFDVEAITPEFLKDNFPNAAYVKTETLGEEEGERKRDTEWVTIQTQLSPFDENNISLYEENCYTFIYTDKLVFLYKNIDINKKLETILNTLPRKQNKNESTEVELVAYNQDYYTISSNIEATSVDINENYNDDFIPVFEDIEKFITERKSGLVVLRGTVGSGKTTIIKHLITTKPAKYIIITNTLAAHIASPEFISFMLDNKDSIFILEDCEQILMDRGSNFNSAISNILNMSDGLLSDIFNIKFICTFNADINKIDPALLRKGRCFANYEFKPLCLKKTNTLLRKLNHPESTVPLTLAEIYNYNDKDCKVQELGKIGF